MKSEAGRAPRREIELDFLRGLAILAVVDFHARHSALTALAGYLGMEPQGAAGVNVFFVLSGFLVGGLLIKEWKVRGRVDSKRFLIRRGFKIWPQFYLFLLINLVTGHRSWGQLWPSFVNIQNYFPSSGVAHLWSLGVEEHAYLLLTLILALAWHWKWRMRTIVVLLGTLALTAVGLRIVMIELGYPYFTPTHTRIEAIFYGVILAILFHTASATFVRLQNLRWLWAAALVGALLFLRFYNHHPWSVSVTIDMQDLIGVSALMLIYRHRQDKKRSLLYRFIAWIGLYSYGIYLWHISMDSAIVAVANRLPRRWSEAWTIVAEPCLGIALGMLMTKVVEFPMLRLRDRWFPRKVESAVEDTPAESAALAT
jgi:peptidoglycan/LPS O-acetylase OafA/YrhL